MFVIPDHLTKTLYFSFKLNTETRDLERELLEFVLQKGKIPYAWQEALLSTSAVRFVKTETNSMNVLYCHVLTLSSSRKNIQTSPMIGILFQDPPTPSEIALKLDTFL